MKNKKGFTLTEILIVIVLLVSITTSSVIGIEQISKRTKENRLKEIINEIELAADTYINNRPEYVKDLLNGTVDEMCTKILVLQEEDLLSNDLINPITEEIISGDLCVISKLNEEGVIEHSFSN